MKTLRVHFLMLFGLLLFCFSSMVFAQKTDTYNLDETYSISENGTIELRSHDAGLVEINGSDRDNVRLVVTYREELEGVRIGKQDKFVMDVEERNGDLFIHEKSRDRGFNLNIGNVKRKYTITILAPSDANLDLYGDDDTYEISDMNANIRIDSDDSEISLRDCKGEDFRFDFDDGELIMNNGRGKLVVNFDDGEADIRNSQFTDVDIENDDGEISLATVLADNGDYSFTSDDGNIDLTILGGGGEFRIEHDDIRVSADTDFEQIERNENFTRYRLAGGSARVQIDTDGGDIRLFTQ